MTVHTHPHEAMATTFVAMLVHPAADYAAQAAAAAFREIDRLEGELSRFIESSDLARANRLAEGASTVIGADAMACLLDAVQVSELTRGAFDPAYATARAGGAQAPAFALEVGAHRLTSLVPRLQLDLGAVGKGYALDRAADLLREWEIGSFLLQSGGSTVLAQGAPPGLDGWTAQLAEADTRHDIVLHDRAVSASGTSVQGGHLVDPRTGQPAAVRARVWAFAATAARSDALSTAFFVSSDDEIENVCARDRAIGAAWVDRAGAMQWRGATAPVRR